MCGNNITSLNKSVGNISPSSFTFSDDSNYLHKN